MFCPKCGSILFPKIVKDKKVAECSCGYKDSEAENLGNIKQKIKASDDIAVVDKEIDILPECDEECPKCGNNKASFWTIQTRASDEPETKFLKCKQCKHTWRDYG
jgi:DNA-directed RNA polymerase subunit M